MSEFGNKLQIGPAYYFARVPIDKSTGLPKLTISGEPPDPAMDGEIRVPWPETGLYLGRTEGGISIDPQFKATELSFNLNSTPEEAYLEDRKILLNVKLAYNGDQDVMDLFEFDGNSDGFVYEIGSDNDRVNVMSLLVAITNIYNDTFEQKARVLYRYYRRAWPEPAKFIYGPGHNYIQTAFHALCGKSNDGCSMGGKLGLRWGVHWYSPNDPINIKTGQKRSDAIPIIPYPLQPTTFYGLNLVS
jgi:hypothetical protein